jgi:hypothetical protein
LNAKRVGGRLKFTIEEPGELRKLDPMLTSQGDKVIESVCRLDVLEQVALFVTAIPQSTPLRQLPNTGCPYTLLQS